MSLGRVSGKGDIACAADVRQIDVLPEQQKNANQNWRLAIAGGVPPSGVNAEDQLVLRIALAFYSAGL